ncbi:SNU114 [Candida jiufengensis]|uniref:SNU114 n=1 Tax=Candida jiufengensis TaxID=497108 RepID=UPI00222575CC|nr:SNU114 [Candida jiufengensis]KAI5955915.1 SNU114 [Candida jiufengensis]
MNDNDDDLFDEFGNYIGEGSEPEDEASKDGTNNGVNNGEYSSDDVDEDAIDIDSKDDTEANQGALVKSTIPTNDSEIIYVQQQQPELVDEPIIKPDSTKQMKITIDTQNDKNIPTTIYSKDSIIEIINDKPERIRNFAIVGGIHTGKTCLIDQFIIKTHPNINKQTKSNPKFQKPLKFLDSYKLEIERESTIKTKNMTLLLDNSIKQSYIFNILDTPGHIDFNDETIAGLELSDGAVLVVDVVEGLTLRDQIIIDEILKRNFPLVVVLNKIDRLILELKLSPKDSYFKMFNIIDDINEYIKSNEYRDKYNYTTELSPLNENVIFASSNFGFTFTLKSFLKLYKHKIPTDQESEFLSKLWGDYYFNYETNCITTESENGKYQRTFISFILDAIYQTAIYVLTSEPSNHKKLATMLWENFRIGLPKAEYKKDIKILLKTVFSTIFKNDTGFVDSIIKSFPSQPTQIPDENTPVLGKVSKLVESPDGESFLSLSRLYSGILRVGDKIKVCVENTNDTDSGQTLYKEEIVKNIFISYGRYKLPVNEVKSNTIVLIEGIDSSIKKGATIISPNNVKDTVFKLPNYDITSVFKVAIEPMNPVNRPQLLEGLKKISKAYLSSVINIEENGENNIYAPGEFYMDCVLNDLRNFFNTNLKIKVSDPMTKFSETCETSSFTYIPVSSNNKNFEIAIVAEPMEDTLLSYKIEKGKINEQQTKKEISMYLNHHFNWDLKSSRSVWCFGPKDLIGPDLLLEDLDENSIDNETVNKLTKIKNIIINGFKWAVNEGPLINEPIRNTMFKIVHMNFNDSIEESDINPAQVIPLIRRSCFIALLTAKPKLMEPNYKFEIICFHKHVHVIKKILEQRRGFVVNHIRIEGTPLYKLHGYIPVIDSFGFQSDLKLYSTSKIKISLIFNNWDLVPGDIYDFNCDLPTLKPVPKNSLSRDFLLKTRRRKDLTGEPTLQKYIDIEIYEKLKSKGLVV